MSGRRYRKVEMILWADKRFRELPNDAKLIWLYMLTSHRTTYCPGIVLASSVIIADDLGWFDEDASTAVTRVRSALKRLADAGWIEVDEEAKVVWVPNGVKHNIPDNPNQIKGWFAAFNEVPRSPLKTKWMDNAHAVLVEVCGLKSHRTETFVELFGGPSSMVDETEQQPCLNLGGTLSETIPPTLPKTGTGTGSGTGSKTSAEPSKGSPPKASPASFSKEQRAAYKAIMEAVFFSADRGEITLADHHGDPVELARRLGGPAYPALDPAREIHKAANWTMENRAKAKRMLGKFVINWFNRAQERGGERGKQFQSDDAGKYRHDIDLVGQVKNGR